jgi:dTDP-4-dehydrorhamnose 3,5-epimerase
MIYNKFDFDTTGPDMKTNDMLVPTLIEPTIFRDERGYFFESFNLKDFNEKMGTNIKFVQDNESLSKKGVVRGLHFQKPLCEQAKLVRVVKGAVYDVAVDIRRWSKTFGKYVGVYLSEDNHQQFFIPEGFAHGFIALEDDTIFQYKCNNYYSKEHEGSIRWNDPLIGINWGNYFDLNKVIVSEKDANAQSFREYYEF